MHTAVFRVGIGLYFVWLLATVMLILGRLTPVPLFPQARTAVVVGTAVLTVVGAVKLTQDGYRRLAEYTSSKN